MKPILFRNLIVESKSFQIQEDILTHFYNFFHYHPEIQLTLIVRSKGIIIVGTEMCSFEAGDVFLLGAGLPHVFLDQTDTQHLGKNGVHAISIFFKLSSFWNDFFNLPENDLIKDLLQRSSKGLKFTGMELKQKILSKLEGLKQKKDAELLIDFFHILNALSKIEKFELVSSVSSIEIKGELEDKRIEKVFKYIMDNFSREISLKEISIVSQMNITSFCRFFKQRTRKTFSLFVNEVRIGHACKKLLSPNYNIKEVAQCCGFNNISHFNRKFKKIAGITPSEYVKKIARTNYSY
jgi:AraC-like DNA-binding protein